MQGMKECIYAVMYLFHIKNDFIIIECNERISGIWKWKLRYLAILGGVFFVYTDIYLKQNTTCFLTLDNHTHMHKYTFF